ncbi:nucleotide-binding universal stress UspA family protein [Catalinimonas alkaloidigena]|uniref:universal stress protein n=1 Tax=Catalinimonas alkaloidigena TaxID=1075417 RepID=UPI0024057930|nr:universal stress protein [Catalinimonas alkaloidigena]MDF9798676.1 nucleotide-binding universal stress UspA family protein [Catalinimonas alkaloidigena]
MKTILVTTDYSSDAQNAVHYAAKLAAYFNAKLLLFNAFQMSVHTSNAFMSPSAVDHMIANNEERLNELGNELSQTYNIKVTGITYVSMVDEELSMLVKKHHVDLVVMGMQNDLTENKLLGNTTTAVIRKADFPVLVVPFGVEFHNIEKILFARDENAIHEKDKSIRLLKEIAEGFKADVEIFHVEKMPVKQTDELTEEMQEDELEQVLKGTHHAYKMTNATKVADSIVDEIKNYQPDLLVMIPHKGTFMDRLLKRSITRRMVMETQVPLLALSDIREKEVAHT